MIFCRIRLSVFLLLSLAYTTTAASVSSVDTSTLKSLGLSRKEIKEARAQEPLEDENDEVYVEEDVDEEEEPWKTTNEDWWKDPFSVFSDDEQEEEIDESVGIIEEAESLGEDISMDEPVEEEEEEESEQQQQQQEEEEEEKEVLEEEVLEEELTVPDDDEAPPAPVKKVSPKVATPESPTATTTTNTTIEKPVVPKKKTLLKTTPAQPTADTEPKQVATAEITSSTPGPIFASPLALLVPFFPKIQNALSNVSGGLSQVPLASLAATAVIAKFCIDTVKKKNNDKKVIEHLKNKNSAIQEDDASEPEESVDEILAKERNDIGEQASTEDSPSSRKAPLNDFLSRRPRLPWVQGVRDKLARTSAGQRLPSARELYAQVETLKQQLSKTEFERDSMEKEYEKASFKVQEQQTELKTMGTTTKYLKAQLRDNEDAMNKAIRAERRKAKEEVARMKEAMVGMLNKERKTMRDELKRQTMELRNLLAEATGGDAMER